MHTQQLDTVSVTVASLLALLKKTKHPDYFSAWSFMCASGHYMVLCCVFVLYESRN